MCCYFFKVLANLHSHKAQADVNVKLRLNNYIEGVMFCFVPALLWMFISLVIEVQRDFSIQSDSKVVVHDTLFSIAVPESHTQTCTHTYTNPLNLLINWSYVMFNDVRSQTDLHVVRVTAEWVGIHQQSTDDWTAGERTWDTPETYTHTHTHTHTHIRKLS